MLSIAINKKVKFDGAWCPFSTFLCLQGDHHFTCAQKWCHFSYYSKSFQKKKIIALQPKITKIASRGPALIFFLYELSRFHCTKRRLQYWDLSSVFGKTIGPWNTENTCTCNVLQSCVNYRQRERQRNRERQRKTERQREAERGREREREREREKLSVVCTA